MCHQIILNVEQLDKRAQTIVEFKKKNPEKLMHTLKEIKQKTVMER
jgi:hypothetical protein